MKLSVFKKTHHLFPFPLAKGYGEANNLNILKYRNAERWFSFFGSNLGIRRRKIITTEKNRGRGIDILRFPLGEIQRQHKMVSATSKSGKITPALGSRQRLCLTFLLCQRTAEVKSSVLGSFGFLLLAFLRAD